MIPAWSGFIAFSASCAGLNLQSPFGGAELEEPVDDVRSTGGRENGLSFGCHTLIKIDLRVDGNVIGSMGLC